tara:strand:- start:150 stop:629 length:480 start_codon:yes stop_codon:yes gene_type:complete
MKKRVYIFDIDDTLITHTKDNNDYYKMENDSTLKNLIKSLNTDGLYIYTNGTYGHGVSVIKNLQLTDSVNDLFARDTIPFMKPYPESFDFVQGVIRKQMNTFDIEYLFFDDLLDNLKTAKGLGWTTVWINTRPSTKEKYVDLSFTNIYEALLNLSLRGF